VNGSVRPRTGLLRLSASPHLVLVPILLAFVTPEPCLLAVPEAWQLASTK